MRLNIRKYREKSFFIPAIVTLCLLFSGILIKYRLIINRDNARRHIPKHVKSGIGKVLPTVVLPVLVFACNGHALKRTMQTLTHFRPDADTFPIILAPYCASAITRKVVKSYTDIDPTIAFLRKPEFTNGSRHYRFAINHVFKTLKQEAVVVLEDNLDISPDFFEYFLATYHILKSDSSIWCASAWNDNCKEGLVDLSQPQLLHRTDFFPGMGWMLLSKTWDEIQPNIPDERVEEHLHHPGVIGSRVCIRPEISRTYNFGVYDSSNDRSQRRLRLLNTEYVSFTGLNLTYLLKKRERLFVQCIYACPKTTVEDLRLGKVNKSTKFVQIPYSNSQMFKTIANTFGLMDDFKYGVPRTGLYGIVQFNFKEHRVFLTPTRKINLPFNQAE